MEPGVSASGYSAEHRKHIGETGNWESLNLPRFEDITPDEAIGLTDLDEAIRRINSGKERVRSPLGKEYVIGRISENHWKHKTDEDKNERYVYLDEMKATIEHPHEIWMDPKNGREIFVRIVADESGRRVINTVTEEGGVLSWHTNNRALNYYRSGTLKWIRE